MRRGKWSQLSRPQALYLYDEIMKSIPQIVEDNTEEQVRSFKYKLLWTVQGCISRKDKMQPQWWYNTVEDEKALGPRAKKEVCVHSIGFSQTPRFFLHESTAAISHTVRLTLEKPRTVTFQSDCAELLSSDWSFLHLEDGALHMGRAMSGEQELCVMWRLGSLWHVTLTRTQE